MFDRRRLLRSGSVLLAALAVGHFMQNGAFAAKNPANIQGPSVANPSKPDGPDFSQAMPTPPMDMVVPGGLTNPETNALQSSRIASVVSLLDLNSETDTDIPSLMYSSCDVTVSAQPHANAMVELSVVAPCYRNQKILIEHEGLAFADLTDDQGAYAALIPVFDPYAAFSATFPDGNTGSAKTLGSTLDGYRRVAVSWHGGPGLHIHALEFGAGFGDFGHVWAESTSDPEMAELTDSGYLTVLGNPYIPAPVLAEVYSFRANPTQADGAIRISVEAEVDDRTCGEDIKGNTLQTTPDGDVAVTAVVLTLPDCGSGDGFLVLKNLLQDIKIAQN